MTYQDFLLRKTDRPFARGLPISPEMLPPLLFDFQRGLTAWALRTGRAALFADCGLGKTLMQLAWAKALNVPTLIVAPLCVSDQTKREASKLSMTIPSDMIHITNYERLHEVQSRRYEAVVLDESSILKSVDGKTKAKLLAMFRDTPFKLCCTATPAPNDVAEFANHCEFLNVMTASEMLASFFVHDDQGWRLKGHAREPFWQFLTTWAMFLRRPSDLGFEDDGFLLPDLHIKDVTVQSRLRGDTLFPELMTAGIRGRMTARKSSAVDRIVATVDLVRSRGGRWIIWCGLNQEQDALGEALEDIAVSVQGQDNLEMKRLRIEAFLDGTSSVLITKPRVAGFGMNFQHCHQMIFVGLSDSYEQYYQCLRRCYRFGQTHPVEAYIVVSEAERSIVENVREKERVATLTQSEVIREVGRLERAILKNRPLSGRVAPRQEERGECWRLVNGDSVSALANEPDASVDLSVFSPPFLSLYTYSAQPEDLGNCRDDQTFFNHFAFLSRELFRVTKPGRLACCHVAQAPTTKAHHGVIGLKDFRGKVIDLFQAEGWTYHGEVCIDKDPQAQAIRTHSKALLFVQLKKDASWLRPALADYVLLFRKPGENAVPIHPDISNEEWIEWARPIWYNIRESDTLNVAEARSDKDERHICPLQLGTIERCVRLWSNPGELVLSPFAGIGSEGYESIRLGRRYLGIELKPEYARVAADNLRQIETLTMRQMGLW